MNKKKDFQIEWSKSVNDPENKPYKDIIYGTKYSGAIYGLHYVIYNIVRGFPIERGFVKGSETLEEYIKSIEFKLKVNTNFGTFRFPFKDTLTNEDIREKANEALRIYHSS